MAAETVDGLSVTAKLLGAIRHASHNPDAERRLDHWSAQMLPRIRVGKGLCQARKAHVKGVEGLRLNGIVIVRQSEVKGRLQEHAVGG